MPATYFAEVDNYLQKLTTYSKRLVTDIETSKRALQDEIVEYSDRGYINPEDVFNKVLYKAQEVFEKNVEKAMNMTREYASMEIFKDSLLHVIRSNLVIILKGFLVWNEGIESAYAKMEQVAGGMDDFYSGVLYAREVLEEESTSETKRKITPAQKAAYWKYMVWPTGLYDTTIQLRFEGWQGKAPYWLFLESGNMSHELAFPNFIGTNFFWNSLTEIQSLYQAAFAASGFSTEETGKDDSIELQMIVEEVVSEFLRNPDYYQPGEVLKRFYDYTKNRNYEFYVTKKGRLGKRVVR